MGQRTEPLVLQPDEAQFVGDVIGAVIGAGHDAANRLLDLTEHQRDEAQALVVEMFNTIERVHEAAPVQVRAIREALEYFWPRVSAVAQSVQFREEHQ